MKIDLLEDLSKKDDDFKLAYRKGFADCEYIWKCKIKEEIEDKKKIMEEVESIYSQYALIDEWRNAKAQIQVLQKLLERWLDE